MFIHNIDLAPLSGSTLTLTSSICIVMVLSCSSVLILFTCLRCLTAWQKNSSSELVVLSEADSFVAFFKCFFHSLFFDFGLWFLFLLPALHTAAKWLNRLHFEHFWPYAGQRSCDSVSNTQQRMRKVKIDSRLDITSLSCLFLLCHKFPLSFSRPCLTKRPFFSHTSFPAKKAAIIFRCVIMRSTGCAVQYWAITLRFNNHKSHLRAHSSMSAVNKESEDLVYRHFYGHRHHGLQDVSMTLIDKSTCLLSFDKRVCYPSVCADVTSVWIATVIYGYSCSARRVIRTLHVQLEWLPAAACGGTFKW